MFSSTSNRAYTVALAITAIIFILIALLLSTGKSVVSCFEHDVALLLVGGWRVLNGQVPHNDFYCPLGAAVPFLLGLGLHFGGAAHAVGVASILVLSFVAVVLFYTAKQRVPAFWLIVLSLWMMLCVSIQRPLGYSVFSISPAMQYNRWGDALVCLLCIVLFFDRRENDENATVKRRILIESALVGTIVSLCAFIKLSYFAIAFAALIFFLMSRQANKFNKLAFAAGLCAVSLFFFLGLNVHPASMFVDYSIVSAAQNVASRSSEVLSKIIGMHSTNLLGKCEGIWLHLMFCIIPIILLWSITKDRARTIKTAATALFLVGCGWALYCSNYQIGDPQIAALAPLYLVGVLATTEAFTGDSGATRRLKLGLISMAMAFPLIVSAKDIGTICISLNGGNGGNGTGSPTTLFGMSWTGKLGPDYVDYVNSGVDLIRKHKLDGDPIETFDFSNPFPVLLSAKPAEGGALWWHYDYTFNDSSRAHPAAEQILKNARVLMVPQINKNQHFNALATQQLVELYGESINRDFTVVDENDSWRLFLKK